MPIVQGTHRRDEANGFLVIARLSPPFPVAGDSVEAGNGRRR